MRPRLLDLFCCEGGASKGYDRAGFQVYGLDLFQKFSRKRYPFPSYQGDALDALRRLLAGDTLPFTDQDGTVEWLTLADFAAIAASPPCQFYSITKHSHSNQHPDLIDPVRALLDATGLPYVIENVPGAPLRSPLTLCGTEFNLTATDEDGQRLHLKRHRLFESNVLLLGAGGCRCAEFKRRGFGVGGVYSGGSVDKAHAKYVRRGGYTPAKHVREALIGADWMTLDGLSQSIPPAYAEHIGQQLIAHVEAEKVA
jgi:DNA (cytosine-5)-methyltransferase 1